MAIRDELVGGGWANPWDISLGIDGVYAFNGVGIEERHVVSLDLSNCGLGGDFPYSALRLPHLRTLNLAGNSLSGDIGAGVEVAAQTTALYTEQISSIDLSNNKLSGNIATLANRCPNLQTLKASGNCLTEVSPLISPNVTALNLDAQTIDRIIDLNLTDVAGMASAMPSILTYDHAAQAYTQDVRMRLSTNALPADQWTADLICRDGGLTVQQVSDLNIYSGKSEDLLSVAMLNGSSTSNGSTLKAHLHHAAGDADFSGSTDVADLQALILQIFGNFSSTKPFNLTAASTVDDGVLNVQDVVGEVNLLLADNATPACTTQKCSVLKEKVFGAEVATVRCSSGALTVETSRPVAAFDITVANATTATLAQTLESLGMVCHTKSTPQGLRIIGYSLCGGCLPAGETTIATCEGEGASVAAAVMADEEACKMDVKIDGQTATDVRHATADMPGVELADGALTIRPAAGASRTEWHVATPDGRTIAKGTIAAGSNSTETVHLHRQGIVIVTIKTDHATMTKKLINNR